jgi:hypothetical protein
MRKLVFILIASIAAVTFIRAFDKTGDVVHGFSAGGLSDYAGEGYASIISGASADTVEADHEAP